MRACAYECVYEYFIAISRKRLAGMCVCVSVYVCLCVFEFVHCHARFYTRLLPNAELFLLGKCKKISTVFVCVCVFVCMRLCVTRVRGCLRACACNSLLMYAACTVNLY